MLTTAVAVVHLTLAMYGMLPTRILAEAMSKNTHKNKFPNDSLIPIESPNNYFCW